VHIRFAEIAAANPDSVAVSWADGQLTYRELDALADRLAAALQRAGVGGESPVAIVLSRDPHYVAAMLAILKTGGIPKRHQTEALSFDQSVTADKVSSCSRFRPALFQFSKRAASEAAKFGRSGVEFLCVIGAARFKGGEPATGSGRVDPEATWRLLRRYLRLSCGAL